MSLKLIYKILDVFQSQPKRTPKYQQQAESTSFNNNFLLELLLKVYNLSPILCSLY